MSALHPIFQGICEDFGLVPPRMARCTCGEERPSSERDRLFGFTDRTINSDWSQKHCRQCGMTERAHHPGCSEVQPDRYQRHQFEPRHEAAEFDTFYCGCRGWD
jgi:hypothetical protein